MSSKKVEKFKPWEMKRLLNESLIDNHQIVGCKSFDSFIERDILRSMLAGKKNSILNAKELRIEWLSENATNYDLFGLGGEDELFVIIESENLNKDCQEFFIECAHQLTKKFVLLYSKKSAHLDKVNSMENTYCFEVTAPPFWEFSQYFTFLLESSGVDFDSELRRVSFEGKEMGPAEIAQFVEKLALENPNKSLSYQFVQGLLDQEVDDRFKIAEYLNRKDFKSYYEALEDFVYDANRLRPIVTSLQSHLLKIKYPSYQKKKKKLSNYDKAINTANRIWRPLEIADFLKELSEIELQTKIAPKDLVDSLRTKKGRRLTSPNM